MLLSFLAIIKVNLINYSAYLTRKVVVKKKVKKRITKKVSFQYNIPLEKQFPLLDKYQLSMLSRKIARERRAQRLLAKNTRGFRHRLKLFTAIIKTKKRSLKKFKRVLDGYLSKYYKHKRPMTFTHKERRWLFYQYNLHMKLRYAKKFFGIPFSTPFVLECLSLLYSYSYIIISKIIKLFKINPHRIKWFVSNPLFKSKLRRKDIEKYTILEETQPHLSPPEPILKNTEPYQNNLFEFRQTKELFSRKYEETDFGALDEITNDWEDEAFRGTIRKVKISFRRAFRLDLREYRRFKPWRIPWGYISRNRRFIRVFKLRLSRRMKRRLKKIPKYFYHKNEASFGYNFHGYAEMAFVNKIRYFFYHKIISRFNFAYASLLTDTLGYYTFDKKRTYLTYPLFLFLSIQKRIYRFYYTKVRRVFEDSLYHLLTFLRKYTNIPYKTNPLLNKAIIKKKRKIFLK
jgi:hypothetical protein